MLSTFEGGYPVGAMDHHMTETDAGVEEAREDWRHRVACGGHRLPAGLLPRKKVNTIELRMGKAITPDGDDRALSIVLAHIGLEPAR
jgi:hypothetical protein